MNIFDIMCGPCTKLLYVMKLHIPSIEVPITVPPVSAWTDDLIKQRLLAELRDYGSFGHGEVQEQRVCKQILNRI